jgi:Uma2 family endonuclease
MVISERLYTAEEFLALASTPENRGKRLELIKGELVEIPPSRKTRSSRRVLFAISVNFSMSMISAM